MKTTMTIHEALAKLKLYDQKIARKTSSEFVATNRHDNAIIKGKSVEAYASELQANYQSVNAMIFNRAKLKQAIIMSNAQTKVDINGIEYSVAEAIERKNSIAQMKTLADTLKRQFNKANMTVNSWNEDLSDKADRYIATVMSADKTNRPADEIAKMKEDYVARNTMDLVDPNNLGNAVDSLEQEYENFISDVDFRLSESNAMTTIEVDLATE